MGRRFRRLTLVVRNPAFRTAHCRETLNSDVIFSGTSEMVNTKQTIFFLKEKLDLRKKKWGELKMRSGEYMIYRANRAGPVTSG